MIDFPYKHGDRPLDGYTIQRGAGRGGFGEVYYAVSDAGREVALKALNAYEQIELRGISNCMNLKNPHLVAIFDVRYNVENRPFVIMEYVAGPSLRQLLDESPAGLGTQKAAFFLREIGKGLSFLHDHGIVHRDLKPANIFFENGYVKIGDYGLSKLIAATHTSAQTVTVGTVHYMAPEIGAGKYDRSIDIYALGAVLYEMLTGTVPFTGASPSEVLLKHLGAEPDITGIAEPFATVIRKAMAKDPAQRYQSVQEVVEAVFGAEHVRQSVSVFSPDQLSVVAAYAAQRVPVGVGAGGGSSSSTTSSQSPPDGGLGAFGNRIAGWGDRMIDLGVRVVGGREAPLEGVNSRTMEVAPPSLPAGKAVPVNDTTTPGQRWIIALIVAAAGGLFAASLSGDRRPEPFLIFLFAMLAALGGALGIRLAVRRLTPQMKTESEAIHRIGVGGLASLFAAAISFPFWVDVREPSGLWIAIFAPLFCMDAAAWAAPDRPQRVSFWDTAFLAAIFAFILSAIFHGASLVPVVTLTALCLVTQILAPWDRRAAATVTAAAAAREQQRKPHAAVPAVAASSSWSPSAAPATPAAAHVDDEPPISRRELRRLRRLERRSHRRLTGGGMFFALVAFLLLVPAMALTLLTALDVPKALSVGLPDPQAAHTLNTEIFSGYMEWPALLSRVGVVVAGLMTVLTLAASALARRRGGVLHVIRGMLGIAMLLVSIGLLGGAFSRNGWWAVAEYVHRDQFAAALAAFLDRFNGHVLLMAVGTFIIAMVIIVWPAAAHRTPAPPSESRGVA